MKRGRGGIKFEDIALGSGNEAVLGTLVEVEYDLSLNRGEVLEAGRGCAFRIGERKVIAGLEYGVEGMRVGGERRLRIGPHLAYRDVEIGGIPANALLDMRVRLLKVEP